MKVGIIGLGRMGNAIAYRLLKAGHEVIGFDIDVEHARNARQMGVEVVAYAPLVCDQARFVWLMLPAGAVIDGVIQELLPYLRSGDVLVDGGNSFYQDSIRRAHYLAKDEIAFLDCGTSGGLHGREQGFCLMIGGEKKIYTLCESLFKVLAAPQGYAYVGPSGAGHYVKMVHNGIEYALLQAYAEGFHLLHEGYFENLDLEEISRVWTHGSVIRSWILQLLREIMQEDQEFKDISGRIDQSGTGRWAVHEAYQRNIQLPCIEEALKVRAWSQQTNGNYATKLVALLRNKFGGHRVYKKSEEL